MPERSRAMNTDWFKAFNDLTKSVSVFEWWMSWMQYGMQQYFIPVTDNEARSLRACYDLQRKRLDWLEHAARRNGIVVENEDKVFGERMG